MRVLHIVSGLAARGGGVSSAVVEMCLGLHAVGVHTTVLSTSLSGPASASDRRSVRLDELPPGADQLDLRLFAARPPRRFAYSPALARAAVREAARADIVQLHSLYLYPQLAGARAARSRDIPYVVSPHGALDPWMRMHGRGRKALVDALWQQRLLAGATAIHVTALAEAELIEDVAPGVPRVVVPNPIRWSDYQALPSGDDFRRERLGGSRAPMILHLGRIARKKALDVLVRALPLVRREVPDVCLVIAGPDDEGLREPLTALAEHVGVGGAVIFTGMLRGEEKLAALAAADVFALASHTENFGVAAAEALAAGRATVLSSAVNIASEAAAAGAARVAPPEPEAFAREIAALLRQPSARTELGRRARSFTRRYDAVEVGVKLAAVYSELAAGRRPAPLLRAIRGAAS